MTRDQDPSSRVKEVITLAQGYVDYAVASLSRDSLSD